MWPRHCAASTGGARSRLRARQPRRQHTQQRVPGPTLWSSVVAVALVAALACAPLAGAAGTCTARVTTPVLHTADKRDCACWPDVELPGVAGVPQRAPLSQSGLLATQHICSVEVFNGETARADPDADRSECEVESCPYKWAYSVNFVGEVLLYRVQLAASNTGASIAVATPGDGTAVLGVYARWGAVPQVTVAVTAACAVTATPVADTFQYSAAGTAGSPGLVISVPDADMRHDVLYVAVVAQGDFSASDNELVTTPLHVTLDVTVGDAHVVVLYVLSVTALVLVLGVAAVLRYLPKLQRLRGRISAALFGRRGFTAKVQHTRSRARMVDLLSPARGGLNTSANASKVYPLTGSNATNITDSAEAAMQAHADTLFTSGELMVPPGAAVAMASDSKEMGGAPPVTRSGGAAAGTSAEVGALPGGAMAVSVNVQPPRRDPLLGGSLQLESPSSLSPTDGFAGGQPGLLGQQEAVVAAMQFPNTVQASFEMLGQCLSKRKSLAHVDVRALQGALSDFRSVVVPGAELIASSLATCMHQCAGGGAAQFTASQRLLGAANTAWKAGRVARQGVEELGRLLAQLDRHRLAADAGRSVQFTSRVQSLYGVIYHMKRAIVKFDEDVAVLKALARRICGRTSTAASPGTPLPARERGVSLLLWQLRHKADATTQRVRSAVTLLATTLRAGRNYTRALSSGKRSVRRNDAEVVIMAQVTMVALRSAKALQGVLFKAASLLPRLNDRQRVGPSALTSYWGSGHLGATPVWRRRKAKETKDALATSAMKYATMQFSEDELDYKASPLARSPGRTHPVAVTLKKSNSLAKRVRAGSAAGNHSPLPGRLGTRVGDVGDVGEANARTSSPLGAAARGAVLPVPALSARSLYRPGAAPLGGPVKAGAPAQVVPAGGVRGGRLPAAGGGGAGAGGAEARASPPKPTIHVPQRGMTFSSDKWSEPGSMPLEKRRMAMRGGRSPASAYVGVSGVVAAKPRKSVLAVDDALSELRGRLLALANPLGTLVAREQTSVDAMLQDLLEKAKAAAGLVEPLVPSHPVVGESASTPMGMAVPEQHGLFEGRRRSAARRKSMAAMEAAALAMAAAAEVEDGAAGGDNDGDSASASVVSMTAPLNAPAVTPGHLGPGKSPAGAAATSTAPQAADDAGSTATRGDATGEGRATAAGAPMQPVRLRCRPPPPLTHGNSLRDTQAVGSPGTLAKVSPWQTIQAYVDVVGELCSGLIGHAALAETATSSILTLSQDELKEALAAQNSAEAVAGFLDTSILAPHLNEIQRLVIRAPGLLRHVARHCLSALASVQTAKPLLRVYAACMVRQMLERAREVAEVVDLTVARVRVGMAVAASQNQRQEQIAAFEAAQGASSSKEARRLDRVLLETMDAAVEVIEPLLGRLMYGEELDMQTTPHGQVLPRTPVSTIGGMAALSHVLDAFYVPNHSALASAELLHRGFFNKQARAVSVFQDDAFLRVNASARLSQVHAHLLAARQLLSFVEQDMLQFNERLEALTNSSAFARALDGLARGRNTEAALIESLSSLPTLIMDAVNEACDACMSACSFASAMTCDAGPQGHKTGVKLATHPATPARVDAITSHALALCAHARAVVHQFRVTAANTMSRVNQAAASAGASQPGVAGLLVDTFARALRVPMPAHSTLKEAGSGTPKQQPPVGSTPTATGVVDSAGKATITGTGTGAQRLIRRPSSRMGKGKGSTTKAVSAAVAAASSEETDAELGYGGEQGDGHGGGAGSSARRGLVPPDAGYVSAATAARALSKIIARAEGAARAARTLAAARAGPMPPVPGSVYALADMMQAAVDASVEVERVTTAAVQQVGTMAKQRRANRSAMCACCGSSTATRASACTGILVKRVAAFVLSLVVVAVNVVLLNRGLPLTPSVDVVEYRARQVSDNAVMSLVLHFTTAARAVVRFADLWGVVPWNCGGVARVFAALSLCLGYLLLSMASRRKVLVTIAAGLRAREKRLVLPFCMWRVQHVVRAAVHGVVVLCNTAALHVLQLLTFGLVASALNALYFEEASCSELDSAVAGSGVATALAVAANAALLMLLLYDYAGRPWTVLTPTLAPEVALEISSSFRISKRKLNIRVGRAPRAPKRSGSRLGRSSVDVEELVNRAGAAAKRLARALFGVWTREVVAAHDVVRTAELFQYEDDTDNYHETVLTTVGQANCVYWYALPGGVAAAKLQELCNDAVPWDSTVMEHLPGWLGLRPAAPGAKHDVYGIGAESELKIDTPVLARVMAWCVNVTIWCGYMGAAYGDQASCVVLACGVVARAVVEFLLDVYREVVLEW